MRIVTRASDKSKSIDAIRRSLENGFSFGPNRRCACCAAKSVDADSISRGICAECFSEIEAAVETA